jgi:hypothetical protein
MGARARPLRERPKKIEASNYQPQGKWTQKTQ